MGHRVIDEGGERGAAQLRPRARIERWKVMFEHGFPILFQKCSAKYPIYVRLL